MSQRRLETSEICRLVVEGLAEATETENLTLRSARRSPYWRTAIASAGETLFVVPQVDLKATDVYKGGAFRVEFEKAASRQPSRGLNGRALFFQLLLPDEVAHLLSIQNAMIKRTPHPPPEHVNAYPVGPVRDMYLSYFQPQREFDAIKCWLRSRTVEDVQVWTDALSELLPVMLERARSILDPTVRVLGLGNLVT